MVPSRSRVRTPVTVREEEEEEEEEEEGYSKAYRPPSPVKMAKLGGAKVRRAPCCNVLVMC
jgi:hypothetical protein